ncbi:MAG: TrpR like protein, YerC/YecD [Parcubacteria group bacterium GW2011_GWA1_42_7]|nr:MAG: TrpR like protein, YerC/YecD [Parcubacteria group bacterium GW2011_GWB1_42_6]KKS70211.1 MAG: TrpR like protein, YerC/YecD [Parcubacteria group bacterium GW2011_GWA1_42_7]KKS92468.1 MAG: TrpR like protein, YerC/YecD [Parcubacteria group bacterium GW2011_GWC1_43_12]
MARINYIKLTKNEKEDFFFRLCFVLAETKNINEAAELLRDLLTEQEVEMISKRLQIADLLMDGTKYSEIKIILKVSDPTISRVNEWLRTTGDGFRSAKEKLDRCKKQEKGKMEDSFDPLSWKNLKRRYPQYYWPELILKEIIRSSSQKQLEKIRSVLAQMKDKTALYKDLNRILTRESVSKTARKLKK